LDKQYPVTKRIFRIILSAVDITDRKKAELELQASEAKIPPAGRKRQYRHQQF
jgi:hypothetical protein